ncbi:glucosaminidase domain-containing protein [Flavobacterium eburneipallidum]|uniref:glucosaminidase domain-containing protein n=1 Tax=Flavobacterium eburneipallidum TaxID=3003263 RepID=UPI0022AC0EDB|nr:glucosaminidase domain-containing protein [Flavobacterium eburneipallidum]
MYKKIIYTVAMLTLVGCSSKKTIVTTKSRKPNTETTKSTSKTLTTSEVVNRYIESYKDIAMSNMKNFGIPASIILAQGILESGAGQSKLALTANNHFGIKCYTDWTGETSYHDDDSSQECFRKYKNPNESYQDHADIVSKRKRYASLFDLKKGDYKGWAKGLRAAGYATDPKYPEKLISYIESYHLYEYDNKVLGKNYTFDKNQKTPVVMNNKSANQYIVQQGDTLYSISKKYNISVEELKRQNNISDNAISIGQSLLIK